MSMVVQALRDYSDHAMTIFREETDQPQDIAEDITREAIAAMGVSGTQDRLYSKVDVKKAFKPSPPDTPATMAPTPRSTVIACCAGVTPYGQAQAVEGIEP